MDSISQILSFIYRVVQNDLTAANQLVFDHIDVFHPENIDEMHHSLRNVGKNDPPALRAKKLTLMGDFFSGLSKGPLAFFREVALESFEVAVTLVPPKAEWLLQSAACWYQRIDGDREYNLARAIQQLERCLRTATANQMGERGLANNLMGLILSDPAFGGEPVKLREAEACFKDALHTFQKLREKAYVAMVELNLGNLFASEKKTGVAIDHYSSALQEYLEVGDDKDIALAERNLGVTLLEYDDGDRALKIEEAIQHLERSLSRLSQDDLHDRAVTLNNIGKAYASRIKGDQTENFEKSRDSFERAATLFCDLKEWPEARIANASAGGISFELKEWNRAATYFSRAIGLMDQEWQRKLTAQGRLKLDREVSDLFDFAILAALKEDKRDDLVDLIECSRQRLLVETYFSKKTQAVPGSSLESWQHALECRRARAALERELTCYRLDNSFREPSQRVKKLGSQIEDLRHEEEKFTLRVKAANPYFLPTSTPPKPDRILRLTKLLNADICSIKPTSKGTIVVAFTREGAVLQSVLEDLSLDYWQNLLFGVNGWAPAYTAFREGKSFAAHRWQATMSRTLDQVYRVLVSKCLSLLGLPLLENIGPTKSLEKRLYFLAGGPLDILPLHAVSCGDGSNRRYLADMVDVAYFSSFRLLDDAVERLSRIGPAKQLIAVHASERQQPFMPWETSFAANLFGADSCDLLEAIPGDKGIIGKLSSVRPETTALLFSCHAVADPKNALNSGLFFSSRLNKKPDLTLAELLAIESPRCALVLLSACETSLKELDDPADECLNLANAFGAAGVPGTIGTQWVANDVASALWTAQFMLHHRQQLHDPLHSACEASRWIRDSTSQQKMALLESSPQGLPDGFASFLQRDFTHPFFWANHKFYGASLPLET